MTARVLAAIIGVLAGLDIASTQIALDLGHGEGNPLVRDLMAIEPAGMWIAGAVRVAVASAIAGTAAILMARPERIYRRAGLLAAVAYIAASAAVVASNTLIIAGT